LPEFDGPLPLWEEIVYITRVSNRDHHRCQGSSSFRSSTGPPESRTRERVQMAALLRTLAGSGRNVQGTAAPVHSSPCRNGTPVEPRPIMAAVGARGSARRVVAAALNESLAPHSRETDPAGLVASSEFPSPLRRKYAAGPASDLRLLEGGSGAAAA
jgi:hypothetical protein